MNSLYCNVAINNLFYTVLEMGDPDMTLKKLGMTRTSLRALDGDEEITAAFDTRREAVCSTAWRLEPGSGRNTKWLWAELEPHIVQVVSGAMSCLCYGYAVQEVIYRSINGRIGIESVVEKPFEWFSFSQLGRLLWRSLEGELLDVEDVYPGKFLLTRHQPTFRNPYGESLYARLYWTWFFRLNGWRFWAVALERVGTPFLKGTSPRGDSLTATGETVNNQEWLKTQLAQAAQNAVLSLPEGWDAAFMSAAQSGVTFEDFELACTKRIQRLILGQTLTSDTGANGGGSYALGQVHNEVRIDRRNADLRMVSKTIQTLVNNLWQLNGFPNDPPTFVMEDGAGLEIPRAERDAKLVQAGICKLTPDYLLRVYDFEDGDFEIPDNAPVAPAAPMPPADPVNPVPPVKASDLSMLTFSPVPSDPIPDQTSLDEGIINLLGADNSKVLDGMLKPVIDLVQNAASYDEIMGGLAKAFPNMDAKALEDRMARALFAADIWGMLNSGGK